MNEDFRIKVMGIRDNLSLKVIDAVVKKIEHEISNVRVVILRMLCLEQLCAQQPNCEDMKVDTIGGKKL